MINFQRQLLFRQIYKQIKKYKTIVIARHIGADPDALGSQFALKELIKNKYPQKNVYAFIHFDMILGNQHCPCPQPTSYTC